MAYQLASASSQYLRAASAPATTYPITMACWHNNIAGGADGIIMSLNSSTGNNDSLRLVRGVSGDIVRAVALASGVSNISSSANGVAGAWQHAAGTFEVSRRQAFLNGVAGAANTATATPTGIDELFVGTRRLSGSVGAFYNGSIAEAALWAAILTDAEILSLARGFTPDQVRPQSLIFYAPLIRDLHDLRGGLVITPFNSPTVAVHPRVIT